MTSHASVPSAAVAIPLALVAGTLVASLALCLAHKRSLLRQKIRNARVINQQRKYARSRRVETSSIASGSSRATSKGQDIEKAINALNKQGNEPTLQQQHPPVVYVPMTPHYPIARQDVRRERDVPYEQSVYSQPYSESNYSRHSSVRYHRTPAVDYERCAYPNQRTYSDHTRSRDGFGGGGATATVISGYISPALPTPMARQESVYGRPKLPPRAHSRHIAPGMEISNGQWDHVYEAVRAADSPSSSHRSW